MRCPDCNKFVGLENQDPEINDRKLWKRIAQMKADFASAFIQANAIFDGDGNADGRELTAEEQRRLLEMLRLAAGMEKRPYRKPTSLLEGVAA